MLPTHVLYPILMCQYFILHLSLKFPCQIVGETATPIYMRLPNIARGVKWVILLIIMAIYFTLV